MKVKVRSRYREVLACTSRKFDRTGKAVLSFRQFYPPHKKAQFGEAYMTPQEAQWLVEDKANQAHIEAGLEPEYYYPAGYPLPVADNVDGVLSPPITDAAFHVSDPRQITGAQEYHAEQAAAMAAFAEEDAAVERGDMKPSDITQSFEKNRDAAPPPPAEETMANRVARMQAEAAARAAEATAPALL